MARSRTAFWFLLISTTILTTCQKKCVDLTLTREGYIIGLDPCRARTTSHGFVIAFPTSTGADTVVTYNLPEDIYQFPPQLFSGFDFLFPPSYQKKFKVRVNFVLTPEEQKEQPICTTEIFLAPFISAVRNCQITVISAVALQ